MIRSILETLAYVELLVLKFIIEIIAIWLGFDVENFKNK